ncbi:MAG TPA: hydantoinase/oxoprolinase family protein, partial [Nevskiaceae bacterium]|nr:hydantoinase/oxoprolinase family protein [Nevskiaceae bacterium]
NGLKKLAEIEQLPLSKFLGRCDAIVHGTTIADNTLIEMNGAVTGLITTQGFRDEIEYRRGFKEDIWDVRLGPPTPITPRRRRMTVPGRILFDGSEYEPLDEAAVREACRRLRKQDVQSVAVSLIFSFVNPEHEKRVARIVAEELPGVHVSISHQVLPRAPEFERTSTTVVNAYVAPRVTSYLEKLVTRLKDAGYQNQLMVMQASGGVMTKPYIDGSPIRVLASGPAGGVVGSAHVGVAKGHRNLLCVDMGGTSYDMSVVLDGAAPAEAGWNLHHRYVVAVPMVKVETLGAGGGSICHVHNGVVAVGPASAGSEPGPICYGRGGTRPTITDALLMLGILSDQSEFAGGSFSLSRAGVDEAFRALGQQMGYSAEDAAFDCWRVVNANMSHAVRRTVAGKGIDPQEMVMLAYGGNGPVFAAIQAEALDIDTVLVPKASPTFSALGTLAAKPSIDEERSYLTSVAALDPARLKALWKELDDRARAFIDDTKASPERVIAQYRMNMRYPGQNSSLSFDLAVNRGAQDLSFVDDGIGARAVAAFNAAHQAEFGHVREGEMPEVTGVRLSITVETQAPRVVAGSTATRVPARAVRMRRANLGDGFRSTEIFRGADLEPGHEVTGPAIIEETFTTIVVYPGWKAHVDDAGDYELSRTVAAASKSKSKGKG